jgi:hypothetical protein
VQRDHRFHRRQQLVLGNERVDDDCFARLVPEAAAGEQAEAGAPSFRVAITARSCSSPCAQSLSQPEKLILNLRGICWFSGLRRKCDTAASRCAGDVRVFLWANAGHAAGDMLRTVLAQASRVVSFACASRRIAAGVSASGDRMDLNRFARRNVRVRMLVDGVPVDDLGDRLQLVGVEAAARAP